MLEQTAIVLSGSRSRPVVAGTGKTVATRLRPRTSCLAVSEFLSPASVHVLRRGWIVSKVDVPAEHFESPSRLTQSQKTLAVQLLVGLL